MEQIIQDMVLAMIIFLGVIGAALGSVILWFSNKK